MSTFASSSDDDDDDTMMTERTKVNLVYMCEITSIVIFIPF